MKLANIPCTTGHWKLFAFLGVWILITNSSFGQSGCVQRINKDSIKVYACKTADSKIKSLKTELNIHATMQQVINVVLNVNDYNNWQYHTVNAHILNRKSDTELIYYSEIVSPWLVSNRDLVVHLKIEHAPETQNLMIYTNSIPDYIPSKEGIVRVPMSKSKWKVSQIDESTLHVEFIMLVDPGGSVPAWLINMVAAEAPYESFRNFKHKIERR